MRIEATLDVEAVDPLIFYATGRLPGVGDRRLAGLRPALLARYGDLARLRYDFPLVLTGSDDGRVPVRPLSAIVDGLLEKIAPPGGEGELMRRATLRLEREIRTLSASGLTGSLSELWDKAAANLDQAAFGDVLKTARAALETDGAVIDCEAEAAETLIAHLWSHVQAEKSRRFRDTAARLIARLEDILRSDRLRSADGRSAESLRAMIGPAHQSLFDFGTLSTLLPKSTERDALPVTRRVRITWALDVLKRQRFFVSSGEGYNFRFTSCGDALSAYRKRLPEVAELIKAISIAELECIGAYSESRHDAFFANFDAAALGPDDHARFPDYLLVLGEGGVPFDNTGLLAVLSSSIPFKILVTAGDLAAGTPAGDDPAILGVRSTQLASLVMGLGNVFVVQSTASNLYQVSARLFGGFKFAGPALFSVFTGAPSKGLPVYLGTAAAMQSRAFPAFSYDPSEGPDLASRFSLENNPQPEADWTTGTLEYADADMQRVQEDTAFTFVDFLLGDPRYQHHFVVPPAGFKTERLTAASQWIGAANGHGESVPSVLATDGDHLVKRVVADERAILAARQCLENWRRLQELGGIHNSYVEEALARERAKAAEQAPVKAEAAPAPAAAPSEAPKVEQAAEPEEPAHAPGVAFIETARCSSCNECTQLNNHMFAYNADKQAYIADVKAGTYAQLVEAAESCQIGIIHPGKPVNANEAGLDELIARAEPFQ